MESQLDYVIRKLNDKRINLSAIAEQVNTSKYSVYSILKYKDGKASLINDIYKNLKTLAD